MRLRGTYFLCAVVGAYAIAPDAYGQAPGSLANASATASEQPTGEEMAQQAAQRQALAESIITQQEMQSGRGFDPGFRSQTKQALTSLSLSALTAQISRPGLGTNNPGDSQADLVYTPITPCRIIDTRSGGGAIAASSTRNLLVTGSAGFPAQGGNSGGCGIPTGPATAAVINFVAVNATAPGDLRVTPFGTAMPLASILNWAGGVAGLNLANGLVVTLCNPATTTCTSDITLQADASAIDIVADVQGYFRNFRNEQVKSTHAVTQSSFPTPIPFACTNDLGGTITVTAPVAGTIALRANAGIALNHATATASEVDVFLGTSATDCATVGGYSEFAYLPSSAPTGTFYQWLHPSRELSVAAGTYTYYLNARSFGGTGHTFWTVALEATFIPN